MRKFVSMQEFFNKDARNCFDCPFSGNSGNGICYTHKFGQYRGFKSQIVSLIKKYGSTDNIPLYNEEINRTIVQLSKGVYIRFGTYGEPSMHPFELVSDMAEVSRNWTGYTHQYFRKPEFKEFFMASVHNSLQSKRANEKFGYQSFIATTNKDNVQAVNCPASKEGGFKSNCADCGLCSGTTGKGKKNVFILEH